MIFLYMSSVNNVAVLLLTEANEETMAAVRDAKNNPFMPVGMVLDIIHAIVSFDSVMVELYMSLLLSFSMK